MCPKDCGDPHKEDDIESVVWLGPYRRLSSQPEQVENYSSEDASSKGTRNVYHYERIGEMNLSGHHSREVIQIDLGNRVPPELISLKIVPIARKRKCQTGHYILRAGDDMVCPAYKDEHTTVNIACEILGHNPRHYGGDQAPECISRGPRCVDIIMYSLEPCEESHPE